MFSDSSTSSSGRSGTTPDIAAEIFPKALPTGVHRGEHEVYNDHGRKAVRQRPGPKTRSASSSIFPNDYNIIYTTRRITSSQKDVRVRATDDPRGETGELAQWVLGWTPKRSRRRWMVPTTTKSIFRRSCPVHFYFTTFVTDGQLNWQRPYDRDSKL